MAIAFMVLVLFVLSFRRSLEGVFLPLRIKKGGFALVLIRVVSKGVFLPLRIMAIAFMVLVYWGSIKWEPLAFPLNGENC